MAVTKLWPVRTRLGHVIDYAADPEKTSSDKNMYVSINDVISYAENGEKTKKQFYCEGINCSAESAQEEFIEVKKRCGKVDGIQAWHGYLSFKEQDISPELAQKVGMEFARKVWGDRFQVVVATHLNTGHLHCHFVINSVSFADGKKLANEDKAWFLFRRQADRICDKYGLYYNPEPERNKSSEYLEKREAQGKPTRYSLTRDALDEVLGKAVSINDFLNRMAAMGYRVCLDPNRKYWTVIPKGYERPIRMKNLGEEYTNDVIKRRIFENRKVNMAGRQKNTDLQSQPAHAAGKKKSPAEMHSGLYRKYLYYCYRLGSIPKNKNDQKTDNVRLHYLLKEDLMYLDRITRESRLLGRYSIDTDEQLFSLKAERLDEISALTSKRDELRKQARRKIPDEEISAIRGQINEMTQRLSACRKEVRLCDSIAERSRIIDNNLEIIIKNDDREIHKGKEAR